MPIGQGLINAWAKFTSKHVDNEANDGNGADLAGTGVNTTKRNGTASVKTASTTNTAGESDNWVKRHVNNRKNRRRLHRTVSATDLIRDKATVKGDAGNLKGKKDASWLDSESVLDPLIGSKPQSPEHEAVQKPSLGAKGSLQFAADFFGTDLQSLDAYSIEDKKVENSSVHTGSDTNHDTASVISGGDSSLPARPFARKASNNGGGIGIRFPHNIFAGDNLGKDDCRKCRRLQDELVAAQKDIEYLREIALKNERICAECSRDRTETIDNTRSRSESLHASESFARVISQHEAQIEALKREGASSQQHLHEKLQELHERLQKYASLCRELNEEAEFRNEEAHNLHIELKSVRMERDKLAVELKEMRAILDDYERNDQERRKSELLLQQYEQKGLDGVDREIKTRDEIINDLSTRLERALECVKFEREKQRQRRQIIFPVQRTSQDFEGRTDQELEAELRATRESLHNAQQTVEALRLEKKNQDFKWMKRVGEIG
eukprot:scaffold2708_cov119-Cylindrotheca_fusiformis.AAC.6